MCEITIASDGTATAVFTEAIGVGASGSVSLTIEYRNESGGQMEWKFVLDQEYTYTGEAHVPNYENVDATTQVDKSGAYSTGFGAYVWNIV